MSDSSFQLNLIHWKVLSVVLLNRPQKQVFLSVVSRVIPGALGTTIFWPLPWFLGVLPPPMLAHLASWFTAAGTIFQEIMIQCVSPLSGTPIMYRLVHYTVFHGYVHLSLIFFLFPRLDYFLCLFFKFIDSFFSPCSDLLLQLSSTFCILVIILFSSRISFGFFLDILSLC